MGDLELLTAEQIYSQLTPQNQILISRLDILPTVDSTNNYALKQAVVKQPLCYICLAEHMSAGRGQRGRSWLAPYGCNLYLSLTWHFNRNVMLSGLSLAAGVAVVNALSRYGLTDIGLKWPNDLLWNNRKLAGILVETTNRSVEGITAISGIGINLAMPANLATTISQDWVDISIISGTRPKRNHIAGLVIDELLTMLKAYQQQGLVPFIHQWQKFDCWHGKEVILTSTKQRITGRSLGINQQGALKLATQQGVVTINSGTASLRLA